jgi:hypothetical protein
MSAPDDAAQVIRDARGLMPYATSLIVIAPDPDRSDGILAGAFNRARNAPCNAQIASVLRDLADQYQEAHDNGACAHEDTGGGS